MPHRVFQHITTRADNLLHSVTIFVYLECWYNPHVLCMCNSWTLINVDLLVKQHQKHVRDSHCFTFSYRQVKLSQLDMKWIIYLEKIYGWVAATECIDIWRYLFAMQVRSWFEMDYWNTWNYLNTISKWFFWTQLEMGRWRAFESQNCRQKPYRVKILQLWIAQDLTLPLHHHRTSYYKLLHHEISSTKPECERGILQFHCHLEVLYSKPHNLWQHLPTFLAVV